MLLQQQPQPPVRRLGDAIIGARGLADGKKGRRLR